MSSRTPNSTAKASASPDAARKTDDAVDAPTNAAPETMTTSKQDADVARTRTEPKKPKPRRRKTPAKRATKTKRPPSSAEQTADATGKADDTPSRQAPPPVQPILRDDGPKTRYRRFLLWLHETLWRGKGGRYERLPTRGVVPLHGLTIRSLHAKIAYPDRPSPAKLTHWIIGAVLETGVRARDLNFVDLGAGRGRAVLEATRYPFRKIVGVEFALELYEAALVNLRHWPRYAMASRDVTLVYSDVDRFEFPDGDCLVYVFRPFTERLMTAVARQSVEHVRKGHQVFVAVIDPVHAMPLTQSPAFELLELAGKWRRRFKALSPYSVNIYQVAKSTKPENND
ncbi:MAG: hypothetical protein AAFX39_10395 [Pseudomonadota bacterium]